MVIQDECYRPPPWREQIQAILLAALCSALFLGKALLPGYAVMPFAPEVLEPMRTEALGDGRVTLDDLAVGNPSFGDKFNQSLAWDRISGDRLTAGEFPLWTRDIAGGAPFPPQQGQPYMPWTWMLPWVPAPGCYGPWYFLHQILFSFFAYRFLRRIKVSHVAGLFGVVCIAVGLWTQARIHHNVIVSAVLPLFAMLSCVHHLCVYRGGPATAALLALGSGVSWLGGLPQASLIMTYLVGGYGLLLAWQSGPGRRLRPLAWMVVGFGVGGMIALSQMGPTLLAAQVTARGVEDPDFLADLLIYKALDWAHLLNFVWPDLLAWPAETWYPQASAESIRPSWMALSLLDWVKVTGSDALPPAGYDYPEQAFFIGTAGAVLAFAGIAHRECRREAVFFAVAGAASLLLALASEPLMSLSAVVPGARAGDLKRFLFPTAMCLSVLAALGFDRLPKARRLPVPCVLAGLIALVSAVCWFSHNDTVQAVQDRYMASLAERSGIPSLRMEHVAAELFPGEAAANHAHLLATFGRTALVGMAVSLLIFLRRRPVALLGLVLLTAGELVWVGRGPVVAIESDRVTTPPVILQPALDATRAAVGPRPRFQRFTSQRAGARADTLLRPNLGAFFGLEDMAAYNPLPPKRMEDFFLAIEPDAPGKQSVVFGGAGVDLFREERSLTHPLVDLLGIQFVLTDGRLETPELIDRTPSAYPHRFRIYERTTCLPRATFVTKAKLIEDASERLAELARRDRDPGTEIVLEDPGAPLLAEAPQPFEVEVRRHADEVVEVRVDCAQAGYLRLADPWDAGWVATVDAEPVTVYIADHYLRAVYLEPGEHVVVFRYEGEVVVWPRRIAIAGLVIAMLLLLVGRLGRRESRPVAG